MGFGGRAPHPKNVGLSNRFLVTHFIEDWLGARADLKVRGAIALACTMDRIPSPRMALTADWSELCHLFSELLAGADF